MIKVTINNVKYEFDSIEEAEKAFPDINKDMNDIFDETDKVFSAMDDVFDRVGEVFKKYRNVKVIKSKKTKRPDKPKPNIKVPPQKPIKKTCECICGCERFVIEGNICEVCKGPNKNKRIDIKALLKDPMKKARMIADAVRTARFFK